MTPDEPSAGSLLIQGPHLLYDARLNDRTRDVLSVDRLLTVLDNLVATLGMKQACDARIIRGGTGQFTIYQIISTSHIILHAADQGIYADLFSCEPFDVGAATEELMDAFGRNASMQYCQRNLTPSPECAEPIPMGRLNTLTGNPHTFTHALVNWYGGDEDLLGDIEYGTSVLKQATEAILDPDETVPPSAVLLLDVDPILTSWDKGGFSGGYVNLQRQLTMHTFLGVNAAFTDIMGHVFDLERAIKIIRHGFRFRYHEVDAVFQRRWGES